jgi:hypothetical protein
VRFKFGNILLGKDVRDNLAFPGMFITVSGAEYSAANGHESIVKCGFEGTISVTIYNGKGIGVGDRKIVGSKTDERP